MRVYGVFRRLFFLGRMRLSYFEDGVEAWSDWRRLDFPVIVTGSYSKELNINHVPYRMPYGSSDRSATPAQYEAADKIQGADRF